MFNNGSTTHCLVVPVESTLRSSTQCRAGDILVSSTEAGTVRISNLPIARAIYVLHGKIMDMIADVYTVNENGSFTIDESKVPPECLMPVETSTPLSPGEATTAATTMPHVEPKALAVEQVVTDLESSAANAGDLEHRPTAASEMPVSAAVVTGVEFTNISRHIPGSPVTVEDIWPFIQQMADEMWFQFDHPSPVIQSLRTLTLAEIQISRDRRTASEAASTYPAPGSIGMWTPSTTERGDCQDPPSPTVMTPSAHTTEGSRTPIANPDRAVLVNRDMVREEVDRALAGAVANLARLLNGGVGRTD